MRPALVAAVLAAGAAALAVGGHRRPTPLPRSASAGARLGPLRAGQCPDGTLPDDGVCIPARSPLAPAPARSAASRIARRADRPVAYDAYVFPARGDTVREGAAAPEDGGASLDGLLLEGPPGSRVTAPSLEGQQGAARVVHAGPLVGPTLVTVHTVVAAGKTSSVLVLVGRLAAPPALTPGQEVAPGAEIGSTGSAPLYVETRVLRDGVDALALPRNQILSDATSVVVDPRNVFEKR